MKMKIMAESAVVMKERDIENVFVYEITDSTNKRAREYVLSENFCGVPALFVAEEQTAGRGRMGRSFYSPACGGLYMSLLIDAPSSAEHFTCLTSLCAIVAAEAIYDAFNIKVGIKWVNDLYLGDKKVAGILAESFCRDSERYIVIGMGINISTEEFPMELKDKAGSISNEHMALEEKRELAIDISKRLISALASPNISKYMQKYREMSCVIGKDIVFTDGGVSRQGRAVDITDMGVLCVMLDGGECVELSSGEISVSLIKAGE